MPSTIQRFRLRLREICIPLGCIAIVIVCFASVALADDFKTIEGKEYKNAIVNRIEPDGIVLTTKIGISKVYFVELPKEIQERFHYDAAQAAQFTAAAQAAEQSFNAEAVRQQQERKRVLDEQVAAAERQRQEQMQQEQMAAEREQRQLEAQQRQEAKIAAQKQAKIAAQARAQQQRQRRTTSDGWSEEGYTHYDPVTGTYDSYHRQGNARAGSESYEHREVSNPLDPRGTTNIVGGSEWGPGRPPPPKQNKPKKHETPSP